MKGLMKRIPPLAPDYSGASSVLFTLGGALIINGADGCIGNVTGYDEPRFFDYKVPIYSSGLREMKAITGDEDSLKEKIENSVGDLDISFIAIMGTPNSAVIASDHKGVGSIIRKDRSIPVMTINTTGIDTYEIGAANAYLELAKHFVDSDRFASGPRGAVNIIGASAMDFWNNGQVDGIREALAYHGIAINGIWGRDDDLSSVKRSLGAEVNLVVSYSGLKAARWLKRKHGMPYVTGVPVGKRQSARLASEIRMYENIPYDPTPEGGADRSDVLIIGDQIWADSVRRHFQLDLGIHHVHTASFFSLDKKLKTEWDHMIESERHLSRLLEDLAPETVVADPLCRSFIKNESVLLRAVPHLAVSSRIHWDHDILYTGLAPTF